MTNLYKNKYRIPSTRLSRWDYGWNAAYFVTICTRDRICHFGNIVVETSIHGVSDNAPIRGRETRLIASLPQPEMKLSEIGEIADQYWLDIPNQFPFAKLGNHIVMPNHVHGIVVIDKPDDGRNHNEMVKTRLTASPSPAGGITGPHNPMLHDNLSKIIRWYKGRVTFESRKIHQADAADFAWQSRFHDHIIRDEKSFHTISEYIVNNPLSWQEDKFFNS